jgi:transposase
MAESSIQDRIQNCDETMMDTLKITSERIDDVVVLLHLMKRVGLAELLNQHLPRHWKQEGLDWGWVATIWLCSIISQGDHRKVWVQEWVEQRRYSIEQVCELDLRATDFSDDRLSILLRRLSDDETWVAIEQALSRQILRVYDLRPQTVRLDATTVNGYHVSEPERLFQFGHSKDDPTLPQVKVMMGVLDPLGLPLVTQVVSGETADDLLYVPAIQQVQQTLEQTGLLFVGDCKLAATETRGFIQAQGHYYLCPLAATGTVPEQLSIWVAQALQDPTQQIEVKVSQGNESNETVIAHGIEVNRTVSLPQSDATWNERVFVVCSPAYAHRQQQALRHRLQTATDKLKALTPAPGRGKRQIRTEALLHQQAQAILVQHRVEGLLDYQYERQMSQTASFVGRGRASNRPTKVTETVRYHITSVAPQSAAITALEQTLGWRAYVSNALPDQLSLGDAVLSYRDEWIVEQGFHRLKGAPLSISPLFVQRDDQIKGLFRLLSLALRFLCLIEFEVRRQLNQEQAALVGLNPNNPKRPTDQPTTERLLRAFSNITLTLVDGHGQALGHVPPLNALQQEIIRLLGLPPDIYSRLIENSE